MNGVKYNTVNKYVIYAKCLAPLHIGSSEREYNEVLVHSSDNLPYIPATGIAGVLRVESEKINGIDVTESLFGSSKVSSDDSGSLIKISDGKFTLNSIKMEFRPRLMINPETGSVSESPLKGSDRKAGHKFDMESVGRGAQFVFNVYCFGDEYRDALEAVFAELCSESIQIGGQKSNGQGFIESMRILFRQFNLKNEEDRKIWAEEESLNDADYADISCDLKEKATEKEAVFITVKGKTDGAVLVKGTAVTKYGTGAPDAENIRDSSDEYIIPGSSFKGVIRNRFTYISNYLGVSSLIDEAFGSQEQSGKITVRDVIVGNIDKNNKAVLHHRIHIDKFTGGVINGGLFVEKPAFGDITVNISINRTGSYKEITGIILMSLRDVAAGLVSFGSGASTGNGYLTIESIEICEDKNTSTIIPKEGIQDQNRLIEGYLGKVKELMGRSQHDN